MAVFSKQGLITELLDRTELIKASTQPFLRLTNEQLNFKPGADQWSIAQVFEHLNLALAFYIRTILTLISSAPDVKEEKYASGWLGDWFYSKIMPRPDGTVFRLKTRGNTVPPEGALDGQDVIHRFLQQCDNIDDILRHSATKDLRGIRVPFTFTRILSLRLGDNLRLQIAHCERHLLQAHRMMQFVPEPAAT
jgi:hypothetical protein